MKAAFVGSFTPGFNTGKAISAAGNQVQRKIIAELKELFPGEVLCYSMTPNQAWPRGGIVSKSLKEGGVDYIGYFNLPFFRYIFFSLVLAIRLIAERPQICIQYNSYLFQNLALFFYKITNPCANLVILIQDVHVNKNFGVALRGLGRSLSEYLSLKVAKLFDLVVPISKDIVSDFGFDHRKSLVFQGGVTDFSKELLNHNNLFLDNIAVFAGGLEPHNGVDVLVDKWLNLKIKYPLHIFGKGSLEGYLKSVTGGADNIFIHGYQPESVILRWQSTARWNFCFRFSRGLEQKYFFPSKFFTLLCAPGSVITNDFYAFPIAFRSHVVMVLDDLSNLVDALDFSFSERLDKLSVRRALVSANHSWRSCIYSILVRTNVMGSDSGVGYGD